MDTFYACVFFLCKCKAIKAFLGIARYINIPDTNMQQQYTMQCVKLPF